MSEPGAAPLNLDAIAEDAAYVVAHPDARDSSLIEDLLGDDVPALIAEIRRLRAALPSGGAAPTLTDRQADAIENEMRALESDPAATLHEMRLFMQHPMPCGHAAGNLLTCDMPPYGCVICNSVAAVAPAGEPAREQALVEALEEIASLDPLVHAHNVIEHLTGIAKKALARHTEAKDD